VAGTLVDPVDGLVPRIRRIPEDPHVTRGHDEPLIREARLDDAAAIAQIHVAGWRWGYRGQLPDALLEGLSVQRREARRREALAGAAHDQSTFVAEVAGRIVGFADCGPSQDEGSPPGTGELYSLYLLEEVAGRGVGRALMIRVIDTLAAGGFDRATLWVLVTNERARRFYGAGGWRTDGAEKTEPHPFEATPLREVRYAITLPVMPAGCSG
jgi:ribosomal protein S18 acetylase RimI-like enzyme